MNEVQAFNALDPVIQRVIHDAHWKQIYPVQMMAIEAILASHDDVLIMSPTASGKTEAAFFPIITRIAKETGGSIKCLYIAPLKSLVNDQWERLLPICEDAEIPLHRWHGDVAHASKLKVTKTGGGILQLTPESLESILHNRSEILPQLFEDLQFIVIDEVHTFYSSDRGVQLGSCLARVSEYAKKERPRIIALSATVGDVHLAQQWIRPGQSENVRVIQGNIKQTGNATKVLYKHDNLPPSPQEIREATLALLATRPQRGPRVPQVEVPGAAAGPIVAPPVEIPHDTPTPIIRAPKAAVEAIYKETYGRSAIIFCNTRDTVEELSSKLNALARERHQIECYLPHHSSMSKTDREELEANMKNPGFPFVAVATATLELGIDIGNLDLVVQFEAAANVSSLTQRRGRSGRIGSKPQVLYAVTTDVPTPNENVEPHRLPFGMLHQAALADLMLRDRWVEPPEPQTAAFHVLYQQILMLVNEYNGLSGEKIIDILDRSKRFSGISKNAMEALINHMSAIGHLDLDRKDYLVGTRIERMVHHYDFLATFRTGSEYTVFGPENRKLGNIHTQIQVGETLMLGGRNWQVSKSDERKKMIYVEPALNTSPPPRWRGGGSPSIHPKVAERARQLLLGEFEPIAMGPSAKEELERARSSAKLIKLENNYWYGDDQKGILVPWSGSRSARSLVARLQASGVYCDLKGFPWTIRMEGDMVPALRRAMAVTPEELLSAIRLEQNVAKSMFYDCKYAENLPDEALQWRWLRDEYDPRGSGAILDRLAVELEKQHVGKQQIHVRPEGAQV